MVEHSSGPTVALLAIRRSVWRHRYTVGPLAAAAMAIVTTVGITLPKTYESTASILPVPDEADLGGFLRHADLGGAAPLAATLLGSQSGGGTELFTVMLESRVMADAVIRRFELMAYFGVDLMDDARRELAKSTTVHVGKEGALSIAVVTEDPKLSADIANFYASNLDQLNHTMTVTKARQTRIFLEARLAEVKRALVKAEDAMRDFQSENKAFAVEAQAQAMVQGAAMLQAQLMAQEVQLQVARSYLSEDNPELLRMRTAVEGVRRRLRAFESGPGTGPRDGAAGPPTMETVPALALSYMRLLREVKTQEQIYILLLAQLEQAKLEEARDTATVQVMDPAVPAQRKKGPKVSLILIVAFLLSALVAALVARGLDWRSLRRASRPA
jgi:tyrosine-protein kinase Etk/Wzc